MGGGGVVTRVGGTVKIPLKIGASRSSQPTFKQIHLWMLIKYIAFDRKSHLPLVFLSLSLSLCCSLGVFEFDLDSISMN